MNHISERISYHRHDEYTTILISSKVEKWMESLLFGWMILWSLVGLFVLYCLFTGEYVSENTAAAPKNKLQLYLVLFLVFWGYYLYKIIRVYIWRKKGVEYFKLDKKSLVIKRAFGKIGVAYSYDYKDIGEIRLVDHSSKSFSYVMQTAFWDIGNEALNFDYFGKSISFGLQLEQNEANKMKKFVINEIKKRSINN